MFLNLRGQIIGEVILGAFFFFIDAVHSIALEKYVITLIMTVSVAQEGCNDSQRTMAIRSLSFGDASEAATRSYA